MKPAREIVDDAMNPYSNEPGTAEERIVRAIEADRREVIEACAKEADPACECDSFTESMPHPECKGARDSMRRIRSLSPNGTTPATTEVTRG